jgi:general secretion pathway protein I
MQNVFYHSDKKVAGFTLVEILVALAILSISLSAVLYAINQNTQNLIYLRDRTFANWVATNKANEFRANPDLIRNSQLLSGSYKLAQREWPWFARLENTEDGELKRIIIDVHSPEDSDARLSTLTSFITFSFMEK